MRDCKLSEEVKELRLEIKRLKLLHNAEIGTLKNEHNQDVKNLESLHWLNRDYCNANSVNIKTIQKAIHCLEDKLDIVDEGLDANAQWRHDAEKRVIENSEKIEKIKKLEDLHRACEEIKLGGNQRITDLEKKQEENDLWKTSLNVSEKWRDDAEWDFDIENSKKIERIERQLEKGQEDIRSLTGSTKLSFKSLNRRDENIEERITEAMHEKQKDYEERLARMDRQIEKDQEDIRSLTDATKLSFKRVNNDMDVVHSVFVRKGFVEE